MNQEKKGAVLVVDDDLASLGALFEHLDQAGFKVLVVQDGTSALKRVERSQPDIILLDVNLPDIDGFEVCRRLKESDRSAEIPVIFLTVLDDVRYVLKGLDLAAVDYITKPFALEEVIARVDKHLAFHNLQKQLEAQNAQLQQGIAERKRVEEALRERTHELGERVKELNCLYGISQLVEKRGITLDEILQGTVDPIPLAWQYPEITSARIILEDQEFRTVNFQETDWRQVRDIKVWGNAAGRVQVCYLEERPQIDEGPFLEEEGRLLSAISERLGRIAERVQVEEEVSYEQDLMRTLLENIPDYVYFKDRNRRFVRASNTFCDLFKCSLEEIIGKTDEDLFPQEIAEETASDDCHVIETGTPLINKEEGGESIGGEEHWVLTTKLPWHDKHGNIIGLFGVSREITERRRAEDALRESEERATAILNATTDTINLLDRDGTVLAVNAVGAERFGKRVDELLGVCIYDIFPPDLAASRRVRVEEVVVRGIRCALKTSVAE